jgi:hypothetical protein
VEKEGADALEMAAQKAEKGKAEKKGKANACQVDCLLISKPRFSPRKPKVFGVLKSYGFFDINFPL